MRIDFNSNLTRIIDSDPKLTEALANPKIRAAVMDFGFVQLERDLKLAEENYLLLVNSQRLLYKCRNDASIEKRVERTMVQILKQDEKRSNWTDQLARYTLERCIDCVVEEINEETKKEMKGTLVLGVGIITLAAVGVVGSVGLVVGAAAGLIFPSFYS